MIQATTYQLTARCACGRVLLKLMGAPIVTVVCYCDDCQEGARRIESMSDASPVKDADGGTAYLAYRKDRLEYAAGREYLLAHKLRPASTTHRVVASCCHSAMYLGFDDSKHWVDVYRSRLQGAVPPLQMRICTRFALRPEAVPGDVPRHAGYPFGLIARLMAARIAMMLRL
ncbi:MAG: GFA family protein [Steroidobacteraceae bacterium]